VSQFHFDPETYLDLIEAEVPAYRRLQAEVAEATEGVAAASILDLGTGTGETLAAVLAHHPGSRALGLDEDPHMLDAARPRFADQSVELRRAQLADPLPVGPFDLVVSALAVHHLSGAAKATLFRRVAGALRPGGRFVLGDVVVPEDAADAVTPLSPDYDRPDTVADQLTWLAAAGFEATVVWRAGDLAVLRANRPADSSQAPGR
jgi:tRNA (cmo5U34)-methyltransferase